MNPGTPDSINQNPYHIEEIETITLNPTGRSSNTIFSKAYYDIKSLDSLLFVIDNKTGEALKVLDANSLNLAQSIGIENGKMLFDNPSNICVNSTKKSIAISNQTSGEILTFDVSKRRVSRLPDNTISLPSSTVTNAVVLNDSLCVYSDAFEDFVLKVYDYKHNLIVDSIEIPFKDEFSFNKGQGVNSYFNWMLEYMNQTLICFSIRLNKIFLFNTENFASTIIEGPLYDDYEVSTPLFNNEKVITTKKTIPEKACVGDHGEPGFYDLSPAENYLFALLRYPNQKNTQAIVYDYDGQPIFKFDLQDGAGIALTVDENSNTIYLLQPPVGMDNVVFKYRYRIP